MKQIKVNENCSGCGLCIVNCSYLQENADGNAEFIAGKSISDNDLEAVKKVISECPQNALELIDTSSTIKKGKAGVQEIIEKLQGEIENFSVSKITKDDIPFKREEFPIPIPHSSKEDRYDYKTFEAACSAAKEEFDRLCWSASAYKPMIKKVFVEYKVKYLKPYYTLTDTEDSAYFKNNQQIRAVLANAYTEITELIGDKIPESWKEFSVYPKKDDSCMYSLMHFEERSESSIVMTQYKDFLSGKKINDYVNLMSRDSFEKYVGEGFGGKPKYKDFWCFRNFNNAADSFVHMISCAVATSFLYFTDSLEEDINFILQEHEKRIKKELTNKITELEGYLNGRNPDGGNSNGGDSSINTVIAAMIDQIRGER